MLAYSTVTTVLFIGKLGFPTALARYLPQTEDWGERRNYIATSIVITLAASGMLSGTFWLAADRIATDIFNDSSLSPFIRVFAVAIPFLALINVISGVYRGMVNARSRTLIQDVLKPLLRLSLTGVVVLSGLPLLWVANAWLATFVVTALAAMLLLYSVEPRVVGSLSQISRVKYFKFAFPLMVTSAMGTLLGNTDTLLVGGLLGTEAVGIYDVAFALGALIIAIYTAFGFLFLPVFSELASEGDTDQMNQVYSTITKWMTLLVAPVYLTLVGLAPTVLDVMFGPEFIAGRVALVILLTGMYLRTATGLGGQALTAIGKPNAVMVGNIVGVVVNIVLNLILIPAFGLIGAALATATVSAGLDASYFFYLNRRFDIGLKARETAVPLFVGAAFSIPLVVVVRRLSVAGLLKLPLVGIITTVGFLTAFLYFGLTERDIQTYKQLRSNQ